jgi:hypothetical protein
MVLCPDAVTTAAVYLGLDVLYMGFCHGQLGRWSALATYATKPTR